MLSVSVIGVGRLGGALALALDRAGYTVDTLFYRSTPPTNDLLDRFRERPATRPLADEVEIRSGCVFITTQDSEIGAASHRLESLIRSSPLVFITSGALSSASIESLRQFGCPLGSLHPLVSISDPVVGADLFEGSYFCLEGDPDAVNTAETIVDRLKGRSFSIETSMKPLYHAAAVTSSGSIVALVDIAVEMLVKCGLNRESAFTVLSPLIRSTIDNLTLFGVERSLTGPFVRGDSDTFDRQMDLLPSNLTPAELETYLALASRSVSIALRTRPSDPALLELSKKLR